MAVQYRFFTAGKVWLSTLLLTVACGSQAPALEDLKAGRDQELAEIKGLIQAHSFTQAQGKLANLLERYPGDPEILLAAANLEREKGQFALAMKEYKQLSAMAPRMVEPVVALSQMYDQYLDHKEALTLARKAVSINPSDKSARLSLCSCLVSVGHLKEADEELSELLKSNPNDAEVRYVLYRQSKERGDLNLARASLLQAVQLSPNKPQWVFDLSELCKLQGDYKGALNYLDRVLASDPNNLDALGKKAQILEFYFHDYDAASAEYEKIVSLDSDSVMALAGLDRCKTRKNDVAGMIKFGLRQMVADLWQSLFGHPSD